MAMTVPFFLAASRAEWLLEHPSSLQNTFHHTEGFRKPLLIYLSSVLEKEPHLPGSSSKATCTYDLPPYPALGNIPYSNIIYTTYFVD